MKSIQDVQCGIAATITDSDIPFPRICAHRGYNKIAPENSLPAFRAALELGAAEIEFDLWFTKDGEVVSIHDPTLERVSNGTGNVWEHTLAELRELDFGIKHGDGFRGVKIPTFEEILSELARRCVMNIHIKTEGEKPEYLGKIISLIKKYECEDYVYLMSGSDAIQERLMREFPDIARCQGGGECHMEIVEHAIRHGCKRLQFFKPYYNREMVERAHAAGIVCNIFWSDDVSEAQSMLNMGIDVILTNDYGSVRAAGEDREQYRFEWYRAEK